MILGIFGILLIILGRKDRKNMAVIYVALMIKGKRNYKEIPEVIKPQVRQLLIDLELEDLITE